MIIAFPQMRPCLVSLSYKAQTEWLKPLYWLKSVKGRQSDGFLQMLQLGRKDLVMSVTPQYWNHHSELDGETVQLTFIFHYKPSRRACDQSKFSSVNI